MLKKTFLITSVASFSCSGLFADQKYDNTRDSKDRTTKEYEKYCGGFTLGTTISNGQYNELDNFITVGYFNSCFLFDFGVNYQHINFRHRDDQNKWGFLSHLGGRARLYRNLFFSGGVFGMIRTKPTNPHPYAVGVFTGLDFQISRHFLLSGKIYPFNFERRSNNNTKFYEVFETGSLNISYVF